MTNLSFARTEKRLFVSHPSSQQKPFNQPPRCHQIPERQVYKHAAMQKKKKKGLYIKGMQMARTCYSLRGSMI